MQPVWVLSVDLQTKTATFQSGLSDAARTARSTFRDIGAGAAGMGESVSRGSLDVRHAIGLVDNTIRGAHSMAMVDLIRMFSQSAIVMTALPFAMTAAGFALVGEIVLKGVQAYRDMLAAQEKLGEETIKFKTTNQDVWDGLDTKIIQAKKEADDLAGNHLAALHEQLLLIDRASLEDLRHSFASVAKEADTFFGQLQTSWYEMGMGSSGARHALDLLGLKYNELLSNGKTEQASGLLHGTLAQAQEVLRLQAAADAYNGNNSTAFGSPQDAAKNAAEYRQHMTVVNQLKALGAGYDSKAIQSQRVFIDGLNTMVGAEARIAEINKLDKGNALTSYNKGVQGDAAKDAKARAEAEDKAERGFTENFKTYENERIGIAQAGSTQRVAILQRAMADAASLYGTNSDIYRHYAQAEVAAYNDAADKTLEAVAREIEQENKLRSDAAREAADNAQKMGELRIAAEKQAADLEMNTTRMTAAQRIALLKKLANDEYQMQLQGLQQRIQALDKSGQEYLNKLKALQDKEEQLEQQHQNKIDAIDDNAVEKRYKEIVAQYKRYTDEISNALTQSIMGHETWSHALISLGDQVLSAKMEQVIKSAMLDDFAKEKEAASAARKFFVAGAQMPFPANIVMAPALAAGAFAAVMAFQSGTDSVPGVGRGDIVPALLEPGEGVVPKGVMDGLRDVARNGGFSHDGGSANHIYIRPTYHVNTIDGDGMQDVLEKHSDQLTRHFERTLRRMNR